MQAPEKFCAVLCGHIAKDHKFGRKVFRYHPRSDEHSKVLCRLVLEDLLAACPALSRHAMSRSVVGGMNVKYSFPNGKRKTLDLAIGTPRDPQVSADVAVPIIAGPMQSCGSPAKPSSA